MKHRVAGRKLGRTSAHRLAVLRNLSTDLFRHERIRTTLMKAKELRPFAERLITLGRRGDVHARRRVARHIHDALIARKLVETISTRFAERPGGYTRILKLGPRRGDSAEMAIVELIGSGRRSAKGRREKDKKDKGAEGPGEAPRAARAARPPGETLAGPGDQRRRGRGNRSHARREVRGGETCEGEDAPAKRSDEDEEEARQKGRAPSPPRKAASLPEKKGAKKGKSSR
jgi:large subunit ribosomal protein L17